jgi:hypothetical protein
MPLEEPDHVPGHQRQRHQGEDLHGQSGSRDCAGVQAARQVEPGGDQSEQHGRHREQVRQRDRPQGEAEQVTIQDPVSGAVSELTV